MGYRSFANTFLEAPPASESSQCSEDWGQEDHLAVATHKMLLQTKVVILTLNLGFSGLRAAPMRPSSHSTMLVPLWVPAPRTHCPAHPSTLCSHSSERKGAALPCSSCYHQQMAKYYHTFLTFTSRGPPNWVQNSFPCQKHLFIKWHMYTWHLLFYNITKRVTNVNIHFLSHSWCACQSKKH